MLRDHKDRIFDIARTISESGCVTARISVLLFRGGPQWILYDKLSLDLKKEWDAFERILLCLSSGKTLYVSGRFEEIPSGVDKFVVDQEKDSWIGLCKVNRERDLHGILVGTPDSEYEYLITNQDLSHDDAMRISNLGREDDFVNLVGLRKDIYCCLEECMDRDWFWLTCREDDVETITKCIKGVLKEFSIDYCPSRKVDPR